MNPLSLFDFFLLQDQASWLMASDKVYSILAVLLIIFGVLLGYLLLTHRKVRRLEQKIEALEQEES